MIEEVKFAIEAVARGFAKSRPSRDVWEDTDAGLEAYEDNMMMWNCTMFVVLDELQNEFGAVDSVEFVKECFKEVPTAYVYDDEEAINE